MISGSITSTSIPRVTYMTRLGQHKQTKTGSPYARRIDDLRTPDIISISTQVLTLRISNPHTWVPADDVKGFLRVGHVVWRRLGRTATPVLKQA